MVGPPNKNILLPEIVAHSVSEYGLSENIGGRRTMEDASVAILDFLPSGFWGEPASVFMVCDGHGIANGERASKFVKDNLPTVLRAKIQKDTDPTAVMTDTFVEVDKLMQQRSELDDTGTTVALMYVEGNRLVIANVGDTEIVLDGDGTPQVLTIAHKAFTEEERIVAAGGEVRGGKVRGSSGAWNAVGRSLGEKTLGKPYVIATPTVSIVDLQPGDSRVVIACDGLWDEIRQDEAHQLVRHLGDSQQAADKLANIAANERYSGDNVSVIVVDLKN